MRRYYNKVQYVDLFINAAVQRWCLRHVVNVLFTNTASVLLCLGIARYSWVFNSRMIRGTVQRRANTRLIGYTGID